MGAVPAPPLPPLPGFSRTAAPPVIAEVERGGRDEQTLGTDEEKNSPAPTEWFLVSTVLMPSTPGEREVRVEYPIV